MHVLKCDIKLAFQHIDRHPKECKDEQLLTYIEPITENFNGTFRENTNERTTNNRNIIDNSTSDGHLRSDTNDLSIDVGDISSADGMFLAVEVDEIL